MCPPIGLRATIASKLRRMRSATSLRLKAAASAKLAVAYGCCGAPTRWVLPGVAPRPRARPPVEGRGCSASADGGLQGLIEGD